MDNWRSLPPGIELDKFIYSTWLPANTEYEDIGGDVYRIAWDSSTSSIAKVSCDAEAAISLLPEPPNVIFIGRMDGDEWHCSINSISSGYSDKGEGVGDTAALAICRAYLDWREKQPK